MLGLWRRRTYLECLRIPCNALVSTRGYDQAGPRRQQEQEYCTSNVTKGRAEAGEVSTYVRARVNGRLRECLLDTGSEVSILPSSMVPKGCIDSVDHKVWAANRSEITVLVVPLYRCRRRIQNRIRPGLKPCR